MLRKTPKPPAQLTIPRVDEIEVGNCLQDELPQTPVAPVSAESFMSLHNLIKQDAHVLNEMSIPRLQRHINKLANAGQTSLAYCAILKEEIQVSTKMNNEAKVRRSTKPLVLGKGEGKVMSYKDIKEARATRAAKEAAKGKGKRVRKRKIAEEADEPRQRRTRSQKWHIQKR